MSPSHKNPACTEPVLKFLYQISDAVKRDAFSEAIQCTSAALAQIQNEIDWCYATDSTLVSMRAFTLQLLDTLELVRNSKSEQRKMQGSALREAITQTVQLVVKTLDVDTHKAPDRYVDSLEIEHRNRLYVDGA